MTNWFIRLDDGELTPRLKGLLPHVSSPECLDDVALASMGVARCEVHDAPVQWWQQRGAREVDTTAVPPVVSWAVLDRPLDEVKALAWARVKAERERRQQDAMPYTYPDGSAHHNIMSDRTVRDLSASTTVALALAAADVSDPVMAWTVCENVTHMLTPQQMIAFGVAATQWYSAAHLRSQAIRAQIETAGTLAEVLALAAWPEA